MYGPTSISAAIAPTLFSTVDPVWHNYLQVADMALSKGSIEFADQMFRAAIVEAGQTGDYSGVGQALTNLADQYCQQDRSKRAEHLYKRALASYEYVLGARHAALCDPLFSLAEIYYGSGKLKLALRILNRCNFLLEKNGSLDCPLRRKCLERAVEILVNLDKKDELLVVYLKLAQMVI